MNTDRVALVTGANKGIGLQTARLLGAAGLTVLVGARDRTRGESAARALRDDGLTAQHIALDVTDAASVTVAAQTIRTTVGRLDVLVNNAGVLLEAHFPKPSEVTADELHATYDTNLFGPLAVIQAMLPLLRAAPAATIVNVSSHLASLTRTGMEEVPEFLNLLAYNSSKTALNAATKLYARELEGTGVLINTVDPGHCATDINGNTGERTAADAAQIVARYALLGPDGPSGGFFGEHGPLPW